MNEKRINIDPVLVMTGPSKRRMLQTINDLDYDEESTKKMGRLFGLIDVESDRQNPKIFDIINEGAGRYYKSPLEYDIAFDDLINFLNRKTAQAFPDKNIIDKCNVMLGVQKDSKILFCANGNIFSYLLYPQGVKKIFPEYDETTININNKLFRYSLNGEILKNYVLYFCNEDFGNIINPYRLQKAVHAGGTEKTLADIKDYLIQQESDRFFGAIFVYHSGEPGKADAASSISIADLFKKEQKTAESLSPSLINSVANLLKEKPVLDYLLKYTAVFFKKLFYFLKKLVFFVAFLVFNFFFILTNIRGKRKEKQRLVGSHFKGIWLKISDFYNSLTAISKIILVSLAGLILLLGTIITYSAHLQKIKNLKLNYKEKFETAEGLYDKADADILFQQKSAAIKKLKDALTALESVPAEIRDDSYKTFVSKVRDRLYKIRNISEIISPVLIADFSSDENAQIAPPLFMDKGGLGIFGKNEIMTIDTKNQSIKKSALSAGGAENTISHYYAPKTTFYGLRDGNTVREIDPFLLTSKLSEVVLNPNETIKDFAIYNDAMYALSPVEKHFSIWKHNPSLSGFGKPTLWATDNPPEGAAPISLAVDTNLYILFSDNRVFKYYHGQKADWKYSTEDIAGDNINYFKIITDENHKNIYLLGNHRISVISKDGEFLGHSFLPTLYNIRDAAVDEASKTIYILDGQKIYAFTYGL